MVYTATISVVSVYLYCGHTIYLTAHHNASLLNDRRLNFFCTVCGGKTHYAGESDAERLRRQLAAKEDQLNTVRAAIGVCPCCSRSFVDLGRHMATKHPDYAALPT